MNFDNKVVIITGAASGIGKASAETFNRHGATVVIADLPQSGGDEVARQLEEASGLPVRYIPTDVNNVVQVNHLVDATWEEFGHIDVLYNNAGVPMSFTPIDEVTDDYYEKVLSVNMKGVFLGTRAVVPYMKKQRSGVILSTASTAGVRPRPGLSVYGASKGAVISFTKSLALELAGFGIRVNCVNPVATDTAMLNKFIGDQDIEEGRRKFLSTIPLGRLAKPTDIASAIAFLASDEASLITGVALEVDGGRCV